MKPLDFYERELNAFQIQTTSWAKKCLAVMLCTLIIGITSGPPWITQWLNPDNSLLAHICIILEMLTYAVMFVGAVGYLFHRFFQHLGFLTRHVKWLHTNQRFHMDHHELHHAIGGSYRQKRYLTSDKSGLTWYGPAILIACAYLYWHGLVFYSIVFVACATLYGIAVINALHMHFHLDTHWWNNKAYFGWLKRHYQWLDDVHYLHHAFPWYNFGIDSVSLVFDMCLGTYLAPKHHQRILKLNYAEQAFLDYKNNVRGIKEKALEESLSAQNASEVASQAILAIEEKMHAQANKWFSKKSALFKDPEYADIIEASNFLSTMELIWKATPAEVAVKISKAKHSHKMLMKFRHVLHISIALIQKNPGNQNAIILRNNCVRVLEAIKTPSAKEILNEEVDILLSNA